jgi:hypothetical protein
MPWMRNWLAICCCSSVFTLMKTASPAAWAAALANSGAIIWQGPHHAAQKSMTTGSWALRDERGKGGGAGHFDRSGDQGQIRLAGAAAALLADFGVGDAVGGAAGGTGQDDAAFVGFEVMGSWRTRSEES